MYTTTISKSGQITLPKAIRTALGVDIGDRVTFTESAHANEFTIAKELSPEEFLAKLDTIMGTNSPKTQALIKKHAGKTVNQLREEWDTSPEGRAYYREKYDIRI